MLPFGRSLGLALAAVVFTAYAWSTVHAATVRSTPDRSVAKPTIYVLYSPATRAEARQIRAALSTDFKVKLYNVRILALADYSGRQKAIAKFSTADAVIVLGQRAIKPIRNARLRPRVLVVGSTSRSISSSAGLITVLRAGTKPKSLGTGLRVVRHGQESVATKKQLEQVDVVLFEKRMKTVPTVVHLVRCLLSPGGRR